MQNKSKKNKKNKKRSTGNVLFCLGFTCVHFFLMFPAFAIFPTQACTSHQYSLPHFFFAFFHFFCTSPNSIAFCEALFQRFFVQKIIHLANPSLCLNARPKSRGTRFPSIADLSCVPLKHCEKPTKVLKGKEEKLISADLELHAVCASETT